MKSPSSFTYFLAGALTVFAGTVVAQLYPVEIRFPDVTPDTYFFSAVDRLARKGIITGYNDGRFGPYDYVTRGQVSVIIDRYDQEVVTPLREQIQEMRNQLGFGVCGDGIAQIGEECDDGNTLSSDGCSSECLEELHCVGGYKIGDRFTAPDGCNTCTCTETGIACTEIACTQKKCFSSAECEVHEFCSVEQGDCRFPCPPGAVCIQACAGVCLPRSTLAICGNGICEEGEINYPDRTGNFIYCPQDCQLDSPICGNAICEQGEADEYGLPICQGCLPGLIRRGTCIEDCEGGLTNCQQREKSIDIQFDLNRSCTTSNDCALYIRSCSPYQTCGKAIRQEMLLPVTSDILDFVNDCTPDTPIYCAACLPKSAQCINGFCEEIDEDYVQ